VVINWLLLTQAQTILTDTFFAIYATNTTRLFGFRFAFILSVAMLELELYKLPVVVEPILLLLQKP